MRQTPRQPRVHVPELPAPGGRCVVPADEVQHLVQVLRLSPGDPFHAFDGHGQRRRCRLESVGRGGVAHAVVEEVLTAPPGLELPHPLELRVAPPRGGREEGLIRSSVELGVSRLRPLVSRRGVRDPTRRPEALRRRWARWAIEACKQCGRDHVPEVTGPWSPGASRALVEGAVVLHPGAGAFLPAVLAERPAGPLVLVVGPEGGLTDDEVDLLVGLGCHAAGLGTATLRVETAALAALALAAAWMRAAGHTARPGS